MPDTVLEYLDEIKELKAPRDAVFIVRAQTELLRLSDMLRQAIFALQHIGTGKSHRSQEWHEECARVVLQVLDRMAKEAGE